MAGELNIKIQIENVVEPILGQVISQIESQVGQIEAVAVRVGETLRSTTQGALPLATVLKTANDTAAESARKWQAALEDIGRKLADQLDKLPRLTSAYESLGKAMGAARLPAGGQPSSSESPRDTIVDASRTVLQSAGSSVDKFAGYEGIVKKLVRQGENAPSKWETKQANVEAAIGNMMHDTSLSRTEAASQLWSMYDAGMTLDEAVGQGRLAAKFSDGQQVDQRTTSGLFRTLLANGVQGNQLEGFLNTMIGQVDDFGVGNTAEALTRLLPEVGGSQEDVVRLVAILQQESQKTTNPVDVMSAAKARFLEYKQAGGSQAADVDRFGGDYMPKTPVPAKHMDIKLEDRKQDLEWQQKKREAANERLSVGVGGALAPIYSTWTGFMTSATNRLGIVVETLSGVITVLGGVVVVAAGLMTAYAAFAKGKLLLEAGKAVLGPRGKVFSDARKVYQQKTDASGGKISTSARAKRATKALLDPQGTRSEVLSDARKAFKQKEDASGASIGPLGRTANAAKTLKALVPEALLPTTGTKVVGGVLGALAGVAMAVDVSENATTDQEKAEGYGEAAGTVLGTVLGGFLGPLGAMAGGYVGAAVGKYAGHKINEYWGDGGEKKSENATQPSPEQNASDAAKLGAAVKETAPGAALAKEQGKAAEERQRSGTVVPTANTSNPSAATDGTYGAQGQSGGEVTPAVRQPAAHERGDVVRSIAANTPAMAALPEAGSPVSATITNTTSQQFAVAPSISINVQGIVTDPAQLAQVLEPEMQLMFTRLAQRASTGAELYDTNHQMPSFSYV